MDIKQPYSVKSYKQVIAKKIEWLWYPYIAFGKITIIQGDPGEGKSTVAINLAAVISSGRTMPLDKAPSAPITVIYQNNEDGIDDTIVPRLAACGANLERVKYIDEDDNAVELGDERLDKVIEETGARVVILDPVQAYWGSNTDMNRAGATRPIMNKLATLAKRRNCAIIMIGHMTKSNCKGLYRGLGSIDIAAAARSVLLVSRLKNQSEIRVLAHVKNNLAPIGESILFTIKEHSEITWIRKSKMTAEQVLDETYEEGSSKLDRAITIIKEKIGGGSCAANELISYCEQQGISKRTLNMAKSKLNIDSVKRKDGWYWVINTDDEDDDDDDDLTEAY
ncbi:MAG: AAA family ATPase [Clostridia bacterium]|uniref:AAA family ATPase n=1 Tax=Pumilibacter muris TaxID=2941510 RepID=UPI00203F0124|nr:AAA family ATPase [Pumilibacter muris]MCX4363139.1 AAA family ATPase [Clostridia bacterium]